MLSTGQRKRAMLARVVAAKAPIWLLDEPANGLDAASLQLLGGLMQIHLASGGILLAASHQPLPLIFSHRIDLGAAARSEEHTSELQSLMRISYAVFCLKKKNNIQHSTINMKHAEPITHTPTLQYT